MGNRKGPWQEYGSDLARTRRAPAPATPTDPTDAAPPAAPTDAPTRRRHPATPPSPVPAPPPFQQPTADTPPTPPADAHTPSGQDEPPWGAYVTAVPSAPPPGSPPPPPNARPQPIPLPGASLPGRELGAGGAPPAGQRTHLRLPSALGPGWAAGWGLAESERSGSRDRTATIDERGPVRRTFDDVAWRYRSAPLWLRVTADLAAALVVLGLIFGAALAVRPEGPTDQAAAVGPTTTTTAARAAVPATSAPTTTTVPALPPPTVVRTTTTAPPTTVPATTAPPTTPATAPPSTPPTTRPGEPQYRTCLDALMAGALPLRRGDPGYSRHLDDDNDGTACEWGEGF
jgi:Excalibur calcium-binding domain